MSAAPIKNKLMTTCIRCRFPVVFTAVYIGGLILVSPVAYPNAIAQDGQGDEAAQASKDDVSAAEAEQMVRKLRSPEEREQLIRELQLLAEAASEKSEATEDAADSAGTASSEDAHWLIDEVLPRAEEFQHHIKEETEYLWVRIMASIAVIGAAFVVWRLVRRHWFPPKEAPFVVRALLFICVCIAVLIVLAFVWGVTVGSFFATDIGQKFTRSIIIIAIAVVGGWLGWRVINGYLTKRAYTWHPHLQKNRRLQTLLPLFRNILRILIITVVTLIVLAELGINIAPLLAGAGIVGVAVGFGAQTLVKDVITGFMVLAEDVINVGDWVVFSNYDGQVEGLTIRHVRLRDIYGNVHVIPWSTVEGVTNQTRDYGYAVFEAGVAYRENVDEVIDVLKEVADEMRQDPALQEDILSELQILGLIELGDSSVVIRTRFQTKPFRRWFLERDFRRRAKARFDELGIEIPYPHTTLYFGQDKEGQAPPARVQVSDKRQSGEERTEG